MEVLSEIKSFNHKAISQLKEDLKSIRSGRANPALLENLIAEVYGGSTKLKLLELASIMTEGPSALTIVPFDPSTTSDIERAILKSPLGLTPQVQGSRITVRIPPLSQEQREKLLKVISQSIEEKKQMIRNYRDEARKKLKAQLEKKEITEDDKFRTEKEIDNITQEANTEIQSIRENKEKEIMEV